MKRLLWLILLLPVLLLSGCGHKPELQALTGLTFDRANGSQWGNQLYIALTQTQIVTLRYIPEGSGELVTLEQLPVTAEQWQTLAAALEQLPLEEEKTSFLEKLFPRQDGSDHRRLTLTYGEASVTYRWPAEGTQLESLLEQLVCEVVG